MNSINGVWKMVEKRKVILSINTATNESTGKIMSQISETAGSSGFESYVAYGRRGNYSKESTIKIGDKSSVRWHGLVTRMTGKHGFSSKRATLTFLKQVDNLKPDLIHLHNIHGYYLNIELLFNYIKEENIPVVWTLHDCWSFTGHCAYFDFVKCDKWIDGCYACPQKHTYPKSLFVDYSKKAYERKKEIFLGLDNMTLVTPSVWLKNLVRRSFLKEYDTRVINNGIDISKFTSKNVKKNEFGIDEDKFIILGVAGNFEPRKGLKYFIELSKIIGDDMVIYLVGLNDKQIRDLPKNIVGIKRTENIQQLVGMYSMADVFVNPTLEEVFGMVNIEALACGTPVVTFDTGGSPESIDEKCGIVVEKGDVQALFEAINKIKARGKKTYGNNCYRRVLEHFRAEEKFKEYIDLYFEKLKLQG